MTYNIWATRAADDRWEWTIIRASIAHREVLLPLPGALYTVVVLGRFSAYIYKTHYTCYRSKPWSLMQYLSLHTTATLRVYHDHSHRLSVPAFAKRHFTLGFMRRSILLFDENYSGLCKKSKKGWKALSSEFGLEAYNYLTGTGLLVTIGRFRLNHYSL